MRVRSWITDPASVAGWLAHRFRADVEASRLTTGRQSPEGAHRKVKVAAFRGFDVFYVKGVAPPRVLVSAIRAFVAPYVIVTLVGVPIVILIADIVQYLPNLFFGTG
jgi:hypothetical protein